VAVVAVTAVRATAVPTIRRRERFWFGVELGFEFGLDVDTASQSYVDLTPAAADSQRRPGIAVNRRCGADRVQGREPGPSWPATPGSRPV
jgi:hypothetical protein